MATDEIKVRRAITDDRARILEISSKIWDGDDYVPHILDAWMVDDEGALVVATMDGHVVSFAHRAWLTPRIAWFEGIRTDPQFEGRGAAKAITQALTEEVKSLGAERINLSTYIDNRASIHILESYGFRRVATFSYLERAKPVGSRGDAASGGAVETITVDRMIGFMKDSPFLSVSGRRVSHGWSFFPFDADPEGAVRRFRHRLGYIVRGQLTAVAGVYEQVEDGGSVSVGFLDGPAEAVAALIDAVAVRHPGQRMECMVPIARDGTSRLLPVLKSAGFSAWNEDVPDVYVYELVCEGKRKTPA